MNREPQDWTNDKEKRMGVASDAIKAIKDKGPAAFTVAASAAIYLLLDIADALSRIELRQEIAATRIELREEI